MIASRVLPRLLSVPMRSVHLTNLSRELKPLRMAALSPTMTTGNIQKWLHGEGDKIEAGDAYCDIETDKAVVGLDCMDDSVLVKIVKPEGSRGVQIGELIGWIADPKDDIKKLKIPDTDPEPPQLDGQSPDTIVDKYQFDMGSESSSLDLIGYLKKCGITFTDEGAVASSLREPTFRTVPVSTIRSIVASRLSLSKSSIPHEYGSIDCSMDAVVKLRKQLNTKDASVKISVNDFVIAAVAQALKLVPAMNATFEKNKHQVKGDVDVAVAVSIPDGLITPVIRKANTLSLAQISKQIKELAAKARERRLKPQEFQNSSFTVSNLGMFGIRSFSAVINPPEVGILAIGTSRPFPLPNQSRVDNRMFTTLSYDARAISPQTASIFMNHVKNFIEKPEQLVRA
ncbi:hypothetical protein ACOME3_001216 [Neoechinorhynchus agilis]